MDKVRVFTIFLSLMDCVTEPHSHCSAWTYTVIMLIYTKSKDKHPLVGAHADKTMSDKWKQIVKSKGAILCHTTVSDQGGDVLLETKVLSTFCKTNKNNNNERNAFNCCLLNVFFCLN